MRATSEGGGTGEAIAIGSEAHKALFCAALLDTFNPYKPAVADWPVLKEPDRVRLVSLPVWDIAVQTEGQAGLRVASFAELVDDPLVRQAVELNAFEESRHKRVLGHLVEAYGITLAPEPVYRAPRDREFAFMATGYSECIDSFFAFGLFEAAKRVGYFPPELIDTFEPIMKEEGRHILFFVNWIAWHRRRLPVWRKPWFAARVVAVWAFILWERLHSAKDVGGENFAIKGHEALDLDLTLLDVLDLCLAENERRLAPFDPRLLRPKLVPRVARLIRGVLGAFARTPRPSSANA